ncbi:MAG TPA: Hpt domain-containing protein [Pseudolabrys sp.]|nr:Hpt domain-containing protein [Pseudolabrys sp.]
MAQLAALPAESAAPRAPAIDRAHLGQMTFGDRGLERELLQLFDRQAAILMARMRSGEPDAVATLAHTLKGSAVGIGAGEVARAAAALECAANAADRGARLDALAAAIEAAQAEIAALLAA